MTPKNAPRKGDQVISRQMAEAFFRRVKQIKESNVETAALIDHEERAMHRSLRRINEAISRMSPEEGDLVKILVINGIHKAAEDILLDEAE